MYSFGFSKEFTIFVDDSERLADVLILEFTQRLIALPVCMSEVKIDILVAMEFSGMSGERSHLV